VHGSWEGAVRELSGAARATREAGGSCEGAVRELSQSCGGQPGSCRGAAREL